MITEPRSKLNHPIGRRNNEAKIASIEKGSIKLYELYEESKLAGAKERLKQMGARITKNKNVDQ